MVDNYKIKLALAGMDHRSQLLFRKTAELHLRGICELVEIQDADAVLIDMDPPNSQEYWDSLKDNFPDLPVIALSIRLVNQKNTIYLRKPIKIPSFISTLRVLFPKQFIKSGQLNAQSFAIQENHPIPVPGNASVVDIANSINVTNKYAGNVVTIQNANTNWEWNGEVFDPTVHLVSYVRKSAIESSVLKKICKMTLCKDKVIIVDPGSDQVITNMSESMLRSMAIVTINNDEAKLRLEYPGTEIPDAFNPKNNASLKVYKTEAFIWSLAVLTARGRMPLELNDDIFYPDKPVYMQHWPNLTKLESVPHAQQITALFTSYPRTLSEVASLLDIDIKHVVNLFYASALIGYAGQARRPSDKLFAAIEPKKDDNTSILSAIMKRLRSININKAQSA